MQNRTTQTDRRILEFDDRLIQSGEDLRSSDQRVFLQELVQ